MITFVRLPETSVFYKRIDNSPSYFFVRLFFPFWVLGSSKQADSVQSHSDLRAFPPQFSPRIYNSFFEIRVHSPCNYTDIPWPAQSETIAVVASVLSAPVLNAAITFCQLGSFVLYAISSSRCCHLIHGISELNVCCLSYRKEAIGFEFCFYSHRWERRISDQKAVWTVYRDRVYDCNWYFYASKSRDRYRFSSFFSRFTRILLRVVRLTSAFSVYYDILTTCRV